MPTEDELGQFEELYWDNTYDEIADQLGIGRRTAYSWAKEYFDFPKKTDWNRVEWTHGVSMDRILRHLHYDALMTQTEMGEVLDVSHSTIQRWFEKVGVERRSASEANQLRMEQMDEGERRELTENARERHHDLYGDGGYMQVLWDDQPEQMQEHASEVAHLGAEHRAVNGMEGVTGQDHPRWSGGKRVYDAVKRLLSRDESWGAIRERIREEQDHECLMCGERMEDRGLDVHHVVPVMAGGVNSEELLVGLCPSCHMAAERTLEQYPGFGSVLVDV